MDGVLIINKPQWYTSFDVVAKVRKMLNTKKVGHTGTLDPMATGVLVVCVGKATKLVDVLMCEDKTYKTTIKLGIKTDTGDMTGNIGNANNQQQLSTLFSSTKEENSENHKDSNGEHCSPQNKFCFDATTMQTNRNGEHCSPQNKFCFDAITMQTNRNGEHCSPQKRHLSDISKQQYEKNLKFINSQKQTFNFTAQQIEEVIQSFKGKQKQVPPMYSSIKVNGKKLLDYARHGEKVDVPARDIEIFDIYDISFDGKDEITYTVHCSKGTYIRALNEDIANKLGVTGTTMVLERIKTGKFDINNSVSITNTSEDKIIPIEQLFDEKIEIAKKYEKELLNGRFIDTEKEDGIYNLYIDGQYLGIGKVKNKLLQRYILE